MSTSGVWTSQLPWTPDDSGTVAWWVSHRLVRNNNIIQPVLSSVRTSCCCQGFKFINMHYSNWHTTHVHTQHMARAFVMFHGISLLIDTCCGGSVQVVEHRGERVYHAIHSHCLATHTADSPHRCWQVLLTTLRQPPMFTGPLQTNHTWTDRDTTVLGCGQTTFRTNNIDERVLYYLDI